MKERTSLLTREIKNNHIRQCDEVDNLDEVDKLLKSHKLPN